MNTIKSQIKSELKKQKLTQTVLAKRLRCSLPFLNQVISGIRTSRRVQGGIAAYLGKSVREIWHEEEQKNTPIPAAGCPVSGDVARTAEPSRD